MVLARDASRGRHVLVTTVSHAISDSTDERATSPHSLAKGGSTTGLAFLHWSVRSPVAGELASRT